MNETHDIPDNPNEPERYEIRFQGYLGERWADGFEGLRLDQEPDGTSILTGPVADQPALYGLLRRFRDLNLRLISVIRLEPQPESPSEINRTQEGSQ
ncbi:hypothetical protein ACTHSJ_04870 [Paenibacillus cellulositrophicus]|uniref:hypothetical protein n=1 Tax=Paenibacillus cellulositrophicus TaxID=562959 RepID=UPI003F80FFC1